jgi:hypothetical protein
VNSAGPARVDSRMAVVGMVFLVSAVTLGVLAGVMGAAPWLVRLDGLQAHSVIAGAQMLALAVVVPLGRAPIRPAEIVAIALAGAPFELVAMAAVGGRVEWRLLMELRLVLLLLAWCAASGRRALASHRIEARTLALVGGLLVVGLPVLAALLVDGGVDIAIARAIAACSPTTLLAASVPAATLPACLAVLAVWGSLLTARGARGSPA